MLTRRRDEKQERVVGDRVVSERVEAFVAVGVGQRASIVVGEQDMGSDGRRR